MNLIRESINGVTVVKLSFSYLDASNTREFTKELAKALDDDLRVVLDLGDLMLVDSSGLGAFLASFRKISVRGGELKFCNLSKSVRTLFEVVRMHKIFEIYPTVEDAVRSFA